MKKIIIIASLILVATLIILFTTNQSNDPCELKVKIKDGECERCLGFYFDSEINSCQEVRTWCCGHNIPFESMKECQDTCQNIILGENQIIDLPEIGTKKRLSRPVTLPLNKEDAEFINKEIKCCGIEVELKEDIWMNSCCDAAPNCYFQVNITTAETMCLHMG